MKFRWFALMGSVMAVLAWGLAYGQTVDEGVEERLVAKVQAEAGLEPKRLRLRETVRLCLSAGMSETETEEALRLQVRLVKAGARADDVVRLARQTVSRQGGGEGFRYALRNMEELMAEGRSGREAANAVAMAALKGLDEGLRGEALASRIRETARARIREREHAAGSAGSAKEEKRVRRQERRSGSDVRKTGK